MHVLGEFVTEAQDEYLAISGSFQEAKQVCMH